MKKKLNHINSYGLDGKPQEKIIEIDISLKKPFGKRR